MLQDPEQSVIKLIQHSKGQKFSLLSMGRLYR